MSIKLISNDKESFELTRDLAVQSKMINNFIEDNEEDIIQIPLLNINKKNLQLIISFFEQYSKEPMNTIPKPLNGKLSDHIQTWYTVFIDKEYSELEELVIAANYMEIMPLIDLCCAKIATLIKDKPTEEIRKIFNIKNDFTPEEEEQLKKDNTYINDLL
jgi:S-phase kinase-associated protein 1